MIDLITYIAGTAIGLFAGYQIGALRGNRLGLTLGKRLGRAEALAEEHRRQAEIVRAAKNYLRQVTTMPDVLDATTLEEDSK